MTFRQLSELIETIRKDKGLSQERLGRMSNTSRRVISKVENGWIPPFDTMVQILDALGYSVTIKKKTKQTAKA